MSVVRLLIALLATAVLWYQMTYLFTAIGWSLTHGGRISSPLALLPPVLLALLWGGWWLVRKVPSKNGTLGFLAFAVSLVVVVEVLLPQTPLRAARESRALRKTTVQNFTDEPFLSPGGNPIGVRVRYEATFPVSGVYTVSPSLSPVQPFIGGAEEQAIRMGHMLSAIDPPPPPTNEPGERLFEAETPYRFVFDVLPSFLHFDPRSGELCIWFQRNRTYREADVIARLGEELATRYRLTVQASGGGGVGRFVVAEHTTTTAYDVSDFYESALEEGSLTCDF